MSIVYIFSFQVLHWFISENNLKEISKTIPKELNFIIDKIDLQFFLFLLTTWHPLLWFCPLTPRRLLFRFRFVISVVAFVFIFHMQLTRTPVRCRLSFASFFPHLITTLNLGWRNTTLDLGWREVQKHLQLSRRFPDITMWPSLQVRRCSLDCRWCLRTVFRASDFPTNSSLWFQFR